MSELKPIKHYKYHWIFMFTFLFFSGALLLDPTWWRCLIVLVIFLKITLVHRQIFLPLVVFSLFMIFSVQEINLNRQGAESLSEGYYDNIQLICDPLDLKTQPDFVFGEGVLLTETRKTIKVSVTVSMNEQEQQSFLKNGPVIMVVAGNLSKPDQARNFYTFDYRHFLSQKGIYWQFNVAELKSITPSKQIGDVFSRLRQKLLRPFLVPQKHLWLGLSNKILFNLDSDQYRQVKDKFSSLGILHFFAISGFHIQWLISACNLLLRRLGVFVETIPYIIFLLLLGYGWLIAWPIGVLRAVLVYGGGLIVRKYALPLSEIDILSVSGMILIIFYPLYVLDLGFILSYLMTFILKFYHPKANKSWMMNLKLTLACSLFSWPILMNINHEWNGMQIIYVVIFGVFFEKIIMPLCVLTSCALLLLPTMTIKLFLMIEQSIFLWLDKGLLNISPVNVGHLSFFIIFFLFVIAILFVSWEKQRPRWAYSLIIISYLLLMIKPYLPRSEARLLIIDVGQGDATLYQPAHSNQNWLIDTGGKVIWQSSLETESHFWKKQEKFAKSNIIPALKAQGVNKIEGIILSHSDLDHLGNLISICETFQVRQLVVSSHTLESKIWKEMVSYIDPKINIVTLPSPGHFVIKDVDLDLYLLPSFNQDDSNAHSIIVQAGLGNYTFLNMADLPLEMEKTLLSTYPNIQADFLKIGHHGSRTSSSNFLLSEIQPSVALISVGTNNQYHHPHDEVVDRLEKHHIFCLATKDYGAILVEIGRNSQLNLKTAINILTEKGW